MSSSFRSSSSAPQVSQSSNDSYSCSTPEVEPYSTEFFDAQCLDDETLCRLAEESEQSYYTSKKMTSSVVRSSKVAAVTPIEKKSVALQRTSLASANNNLMFTEPRVQQPRQYLVPKQISNPTTSSPVPKTPFSILKNAPLISKSTTPTLTQMVDEHGDPEADRELERLSNHMVALRRKMEKFVNLKLGGISDNNSNKRPKNLKSGIDALQHVLPESLRRAMHAVRECGNSGAHEPEKLPTRRVLQEVVQQYTYEKKKYERKEARLSAFGFRQR